jgi:SNF2-related domain/Helicase conserved C-terminal domain
MNYSTFLERKSQQAEMAGFEPLWMPDYLKPFQGSLCDWWIRRSRGAMLAGCGLGKSVMGLVCAQNVVMHTNGRALVLCPLAVAQQIKREAEKFGVEAFVSRDGKFPSTAKIVITNYERLHYFDPADFVMVWIDEGSCIKNFGGKLRAQITEFVRPIQYRLIGTATAAPNDYEELGTLSEALGNLGYSDMLTQFFKQDTEKDFRGWGRTKYRFRGHAEEPFWRWVCSWARACRKPSDLGFDDAEFILPPLTVEHVVVENTKPLPGFLLPLPAFGMREERAEARLNLHQRCEIAADLASSHPGSSLMSCHLDPEGDLIEKLTDDCVQVHGRMKIDEKEEKLLAFESGQIKRLVSKSKMIAFGLNLQHCHNIVLFPSHSWEQYFQLLRRCWRFGQLFPVKASIVATEGQRRSLDSLDRKSRQADHMFDNLCRHMLKTRRKRT